MKGITRMKVWTPLLGVALIAGLASSAGAATIILKNGKTIPAAESKERVTIEDATYEEVTYKIGSIRTTQKQQSAEIAELIWDENGSLNKARGELRDGAYQDAANRLKTYTNSPDDRVARNASYLAGLVQLEWGRVEKSHYSEAVTAFKDYLGRFESTKDYYVPFAYVRMAEAHRRLGQYSEAENALKKLQGGAMGKNWVVGAKLGLGEVMIAQEKFAEARSIFSDLTSDSSVLQDPEFKGQALLGYARCQVGENQHSGAIQTLKDKLLSNGGKRPERFDRFAAEGFLVWGQAEEGIASGDPAKLQWASIRYLRAANLAAPNSETLAEAYYRASEVQKRLGNQDRAQELRQRILKECPSSPWAKK